jgi:hypothetical protein
VLVWRPLLRQRGLEVEKRLELPFDQGDVHRAAALIRDRVSFPGQLADERVVPLEAHHAEALQRGIAPPLGERREHARRGAACTVSRHSRVDHRHLRTAPGKPVRDRTADHAAADDHDIPHVERYYRRGLAFVSRGRDRPSLMNWVRRRLPFRYGSGFRTGPGLTGVTTHGT